MKIVILGEDSNTAEFARYLKKDGRHEVVMTWPPSPDLPGNVDLEAALATSGIEAALIGGPLEERGELLRRSASQGWNCMSLHPPGLNTDPYYQVTLSNHEFQSVVTPDLPLRFHPGIQAIRQATGVGGSAGPLRSIVLEISSPFTKQSLVLDPFAKWVDVIRFLMGEVENIAAMGFPAGTGPTERLTAQLRGSGDRRAEVTIRTGVSESRVKLTVTARDQILELQCDPDSSEGGRLSCFQIEPDKPSDQSKVLKTEDLPAWNRYTVMIDLWTKASERTTPQVPGLLDGMRSMEVSEGAVRSLRRGRALDLHYEEISEANNFKTIMTSVGCMMVVAIIFVLPMILAGPAIGIPITLYLGYLIPISLACFVAMQILRLAIKSD
jgi:myo-inositol 2-dehydrogenase/D-chiro-inositol 1-dehydrogenase